MIIEPELIVDEGSFVLDILPSLAWGIEIL